MNQDKLLIISLTWPEPTATAAGGRMLQLIRFFSKNYEITYASTASDVQYAANLEQWRVKKVKITVNDPGFDKLLLALQPQLVVFDRFLSEEQFGWRVAEFVPKALRILDTEDLHSLRSARRNALISGKIWDTRLWVGSDLAKREIAAIYRCDLSLIISRFEQQALAEIFQIPGPLIVYVPYLLPEGDDHITISRKDKSFEERRDFVAIGTGKHAPNTDSFEWLAREIWPIIRNRMPAAKVHIYGAYLPAHMYKLHEPATGFYVHGWVPDVAEVLGEARVLLAPLRFGAGIKGKLVDSMMCGTPSVTTQTGIEGLGHADEWGGGVARHPEDFASKAVALYGDMELWIEAQRKGRQILKREFFDKRHITELSNIICDLRNHLDTHRERNFIGEMLLHHRHAATKFLAKWIEEKNKGKHSTKVFRSDAAFENGPDTDQP